MSYIQMSAVLQEQLTINKELLDLVEEFCVEVFGAQGKSVFNQIRSQVNCFDEVGCISTLAGLKCQIESENRRAAEWRAKQAELAKEPS